MAADTDPERPDVAQADSLRAELLGIVLVRGYRRSEEPFQLSSGGTSHDYVDLRRALAEGPALRVGASSLLARLEYEGLTFDAIGGMTMGADPVAHAATLLSGASWFSVRKADKSHGSRQRIEGAPLDERHRVILFEDTVSTGRSVLDALEVVAATGATVVAACTLLDRGDAAAPAFAEREIPYSRSLNYRDLGIESLGPPPPTDGSAGHAP